MTMGDEMGAGGSSSGGAAASEQGAALVRMGRMAEAAQALERAVAENPADEQSWRLLGGALSAQGDAAGAVGAFEHAARLAPDSPKNHYNLAVALQASGQVYAARTHLDQALALNPDYEQARTLMDDLMRQGETRGAGMPQPTPSSSSDVPAAPAPRYTPASTAGSDDLAPVGGGGYSPSAPSGTGAGNGGGTSVPNLGSSLYGGAPPQPPQPQQPGAPPPPVLGSPQGTGGYNGPGGGINRPAYGGPPVNGTQILVLGILSIFICGPILGTIALVQANSAMRILDMGGDQSERGKINAGRICGIIGLVLSVVLLIARLAGVGAAVSQGVGRP